MLSSATPEISDSSSIPPPPPPFLVVPKEALPPATRGVNLLYAQKITIGTRKYLTEP
jgi:hypothetical protein